MATHRHVVLLVEDFANGRDAMEALIRADGFDVVATGSAPEALTRLRDGLGCCLVVFDWLMPGMNGEQFHQTLSADPRLAGIPLFVLTGDVRGASRARALGVRHVALKPIDPAALLAILEEHCTRSAA
jgi:two-component system, chemotaxis family, sensor kinase CheA